MENKKSKVKKTTTKNSTKKPSKKTANVGTKKTVTETTSKKKSVTKKVSAKTASKSTKQKSTKSKKTTKTATKKNRVLVCADNKKCFWTTDGQILQDLITLRDALENMNEKVFSYHVTRDKNDFADWVENVLEDMECASLMRKAKKPHTVHKVIIKHLKNYEL